MNASSPKCLNVWAEAAAALPLSTADVQIGEQNLCTVGEASDRLNLSRSLIYSLCARGLIEHHRCGIGRGTIRISEKALRVYLEKSKVSPQTCPQGLAQDFRHLDAPRLVEAWKRQGVLLPSERPDGNVHARQPSGHKRAKPC